MGLNRNSDSNLNMFSDKKKEKKKKNTHTKNSKLQEFMGIIMSIIRPAFKRGHRNWNEFIKWPQDGF